MSAFTALDPKRRRPPAEPDASRDPERAWIGIDLSGDRDPRRNRVLIPLLGVALVAALGIAALRIDLIRTRYAVAAAMDEEKALLEEQRALIVRKRQLRDPVELDVQARARGFRPPTRVFSMPEPGVVPASDGVHLPDVAAAPPFPKSTPQ